MWNSVLIDPHHISMTVSNLGFIDGNISLKFVIYIYTIECPSTDEDMKF